MEKVNNTVKIYAQVVTFLLAWGFVLLITGAYQSSNLWIAIKHIPQAVVAYLIIAFIFTKWLWRWKRLQGWLIKLPDLQGTWRGELQSDWINPETQKGIGPIPVILVVRQTFTHVACTLMTAESTSYSTTADINIVANDNDLYLVYNYTNRPKAAIRSRSEIHDGAAILKIINNPQRCLEGVYWTSRKSRGDIRLIFESDELLEMF